MGELNIKIDNGPLNFRQLFSLSTNGVSGQLLLWSYGFACSVRCLAFLLIILFAANDRLLIFSTFWLSETSKDLPQIIEIGCPFSAGRWEPTVQVWSKHNVPYTSLREILLWMRLLFYGSIPYKSCLIILLASYIVDIRIL